MKKAAVFSILLALTVSHTALFAQDNKSASQPSDKDMAAWTAYMTPGKMHSMMAQSNGTWNAEITMWMAPDAPPTTSKGTSVTSMILGGRYQESIHKGDFNGMPFEGKATSGYDNVLKKFQSTWIDNMGTGVMYMEGVYTEKNKTLISNGKMVDPITSKVIPVREVMIFVDDNTYTMDMYITDKGKEFKTMHIKYTRVL